MPQPKKRSTERRRQNEDGMPITVGKGVKGEAKLPAEYWLDPVRDLYESLEVSGQSQYFQQSDWAMAWLTCDRLHKLFIEPRLNGQVLTTLFERLGTLGVTEGDRRKMKIELDNGDVEIDPDEIASEESMREWVDTFEK